MIQLSGLSFPVSVHSLVRNLADVGQMVTAAPTRRSENLQPRLTAEAIYRGTILLTCAAWETFVEDLALQAIARVARRDAAGGSFTPLGQEVAVRIRAKMMRERFTGRDVNALLARRNVFLGSFDTPKRANVDRLFNIAFDIDGFSDCWPRKSVGVNAARKLDVLVKLRGDIAHRTKALRPLKKTDVTDSIMLIELLAIASANRMHDWFHDATGDHPSGWDRIPLSAVA
jgi:hypothetical protein